MSASETIIGALLRQARQKRLEREFDQALALVGALVGTHPGRVEVRDEALRTMAAAGQAQRAFALLATSADAGVEAPPPMDVAVRLAVDLQLDLSLQGIDTAAGPRWLQRLIDEGRDPHEPLVPNDLRIATRGGRLHYTFSGPCPHCAHEQQLRLTGTLMSRDCWPCPACLGRVEFDYDAARRFLRSRHPGLLDKSFAELEAPLAHRVRRRVIGETPSPAIVHGLGQGYQFLLNELAMRLVLTDDTPATGTGGGA